MQTTEEPGGTRRGDRLPRFCLRLVGTAQVLLATAGLWYIASSLGRGERLEEDPPYFLHALWTASAIWVACYLVLIGTGVQFIRLKTRLVPLLVGTVIFEVIFFFAMPGIFLAGEFGASIAAAGIVTSGGLMLQFSTLYPLWGPALAWWAKKRIERGLPSDWELQFPDERVERPSDVPYGIVNFVAVYFLVWVITGLALAPANLDRPPGAYGMVMLAPGLAALVAAVNVPVAIRTRRRRRRREIEQRHAKRLAAGLCPRCEYSLKGLPEARCPECGMAFDPDALQRPPTL